MRWFMSISFFEQSNNASASRIPFVEDYVEKNPSPWQLIPVIDVRRTKKRTGYMVNTKDYSIFLFEGSQILNYLLEALSQWIQSGHGYAIVAQPLEHDPFYQLGVDKDKPVQWAYAQGKYTWQHLTGSGLEAPPTPNPFLPQTQTTTRTKPK